MNNKRKLVTALTGATAFAAGLGASVLPAAAELRTITVTLLGGAEVTVTVDVPPGTPLDEIRLPTIDLPVLGISEQRPGEEVVGAPTGDDNQAEAPVADRKRKQRTTKRRQTTEAELVARARERSADRRRERRTKLREADGSPTLQNPGLSLAIPGPAPLGVPNFFIDKFRIPPFLLSLYQAAGTEYGVPWQVLAAINEIETDYGRNLNVSSAGAVGWMQFMPSTWKSYGVDANSDRRKDPYNPVDAIFAAARYLKAAGAQEDLARAIFAYNHADWYVDSVLMRARLIGGLPADLVGSLTGLTQGHFPVHAKARYADDVNERRAERRARAGENPAQTIDANSARRGIRIYARRGAPVIAVNDGRIAKIGETKRLGRFIQLQDVYGNRYTYAKLGEVADRYPAPKRRSVSRAQVARELKLPAATKQASTEIEVAKDRLFANPSRPSSYRSGGRDQLLERGDEVDGYTTFRAYFTRVFGLGRDDVVMRDLKVGSRVIAGTILGRIGKVSERRASNVLFEVRPAGRGAPRIDPKPILDGWKLLESTAIYRAAGRNPFFGRDARTPSIGQILLMSKEALERRVLANPRIDIYSCGVNDIRAGAIDRRVLATLEFLAASGLRPSATSLTCGHSKHTKSGNVSHHYTGTAVDISKVNGIPVIGHQGEGSITDMAIRRLLTLQGTMRPAQIISLMTYEGADNTFAMGDHADHIHVGWRPLFGSNKRLGRQYRAVLRPGQWIKLIDRISQIDNPIVSERPSKYAIKVTRASRAHRGE